MVLYTERYSFRDLAHFNTAWKGGTVEVGSRAAIHTISSQFPAAFQRVRSLHGLN